MCFTHIVCVWPTAAVHTAAAFTGTVKWWWTGDPLVTCASMSTEGWGGRHVEGDGTAMHEHCLHGIVIYTKCPDALGVQRLAAAPSKLLHSWSVWTRVVCGSPEQSPKQHSSSRGLLTQFYQFYVALDVWLSGLNSVFDQKAAGSSLSRLVMWPRGSE